MTINIKQNKISYIQYGEGKDIILLHGWGQNIEMMKPLGDKLCSKYRITIIDFPGFGLSEEPQEAWYLEDYKNMLEDLIKELKIKKPILIGHSFGGRVAIKYASANKVEKVVLLASPCVRIKDNKRDLKTKVLKSIKKLPGMNKLGEFAKNFIGSRDYKNASPKMRQILVNTVNEDLTEDARKIKVPTLLIWGDQDQEATLEEGKMLENLLEDGGLVVLNGLTHYAYLEALPRVANIIDVFLGGNK